MDFFTNPISKDLFYKSYFSTISAVNFFLAIWIYNFAPCLVSNKLRAIMKKMILRGFKNCCFAKDDCF
jgi:hypothetical protein